MRKLLLLISFIIFVPFFLFAQKQENFWYFGYRGGFDFNSGTPVNLFNSQLITNAGSSAISDANGNFLFSSNGATVWDANHDTMPNGTGLLGSNLSTQSSLIIPKPGSNRYYYLFTTDAIENLSVNGLRYSIIDKTLNGGLGDVTTKNVLLQAPMTEKLSAVQDSASQIIWVVGHKWNTNEFYAYKLDSASGLNTIPVISAVGLVHTGGLDNQNAKGYMKISRNGTKLAVAINEMDRIELFDFNITTGVVSNPITFPTTYTEVYGVEFSPDASRLYISDLTPARLYQVNLLAGSSAAIIASSTLIATSSATYLGGMQVARDGKIYAARYNLTNMGVINNPNALGTACNYVDLGPFMVTGTCIFGMPNMIKLYIPSWITGVEETFNNSDFSIYPNPSADGRFTISYSKTAILSPVTIKVFDISGHQVYFEKQATSSVSLNQPINLQSLSSGVYLVAIQSENFNIYRKLSIIRN